MRAVSAALAASMLVVSLGGCVSTGRPGGTSDFLASAATPDQTRKQAQRLLSMSSPPLLLPMSPAMHERYALDADKSASLFASLGDDKGVHRAMLNKGNALRQLRRLPEAKAAYDASSQAGGRSGCMPCVALAERELGLTAAMLDDRPAAQSHLRRSAALYESVGEGRQAAVSWDKMASLSLIWNDLDAAGEGFSRSETLFAASKDGESFASRAMLGKAEVARRRSDFDGAIAEARRALEARKRDSVRLYEVESWIALADLEAQRRRPEAVAENLAAAGSAARTEATGALRGTSLFKVGQAYRRHQRPQEGRALLEEALAAYGQDKANLGMAGTEIALGEQAFADKDMASAQRWAQSARARFAQIKGMAFEGLIPGLLPMEPWETEANLRLLEGALMTSDQRWSAALTEFDGAMVQFRRHDRLRDIARVQMLRGLTLIGMQRFDDARDAFTEAAGRYRDSGDIVKTVEAEALLRGLEIAMQKAG